MKKASRALAVMMALACLHGCGSSDDEELSWLAPNGLWTSTDFSTLALVDPGANAILVQGNFTPGSTPAPAAWYLYTGWWPADKETGRINDQMVRVLDESFAGGILDFAATHIPRRSIVGSLTRPSSAPQSIDLRWDPLSDRGASIARLVGTWIASGASGFTFAVDSNGVLTGSDNSGCAYSGRLRAENSDINVYSIRMSGSCGLPLDLAFHGLGALMKSDTGSDVLLIATWAPVFLGNDQTIIEVMSR